ncbi:MAG: M15 family metallopeptidase [Pirellulaceae bacterium]
MNHDDGAQRRAYWSEQMELGYELVEQLLDFPVEECGESFASIPEAVQAAGVEVLFSESPIAGDLERVFYTRASLVHDIVAIGREMNERGWILKIEDGFRSLEMQSALVRKPEVFDAVVQKCIWEHEGQLPSVEFIFRRALIMVANIPKIGEHMSGSAIDISVFHADDQREVWRGGSYLEVSEITPMESPYIRAEELENRLQITAVMKSHGFIHFPYEFWHYNKNDVGDHVLTGKPGPARYGPVHWDRATNRVIPVEDPLQLLNPLPVIEAEIAAAMERIP